MEPTETTKPAKVRTPDGGVRYPQQYAAALTAGLSLVEILVVMAVLGILLGIGISALRAPEARLFANDLKALVQQGRYEAVKRQTPVAVVWDAGSQSFRTQYVEGSTAVSTVCSSGAVVASKQLSDYRRVRLGSNGLSGGIVWLPSGLVRGCTGSDLSSGLTVEITDGQSSRTLVVSSAGAVRLQ